MTQGGSSDSNRHQTSSEKCFFFFFNLFDALIPCTRYTRVEADVHLQSFQQASAKPRRNHFRGKPTWVPTSFFCHCVSANSSTYHPTQTCCFYNHPESSRQCQNPKNITAGYLKGWKKKKRKKKKSSFSSALWLSGHRWNTKCPPDVFLILWYIYRFSGSYQETAHANSTNCRKE